MFNHLFHRGDDAQWGLQNDDVLIVFNAYLCIPKSASFYITVWGVDYYFKLTVNLDSNDLEQQILVSYVYWKNKKWLMKSLSDQPLSSSLLRVEKEIEKVTFSGAVFLFWSPPVRPQIPSRRGGRRPRRDSRTYGGVGAWGSAHRPHPAPWYPSVPGHLPQPTLQTRRPHERAHDWAVGLLL